MTPLPPEGPHAIFSRYEAFAAVAQSLGLCTETAAVLREPIHPEDVRGHHLICDHIDLAIAAHAVAVTILPCHLPEDVDTPRAPAALLKKFAGRPQTFFVRGSSILTDEQHKGGTTPSALTAAATIIREFGLVDTTEEELAERIDGVFYEERRAGAETERLLLRMLAATRDRNTILELQLLSRPGNLSSAPGGEAAATATKPAKE